MYWAVKLDDGKEGYVSVMAVRPAKDKSSTISSALREAVQKSRKDDDAGNVRARSTVMGVRGLDDSSETVYAGSVRPNLRVVYSMEGFIVSPQDINAQAALVRKEIKEQEKK
jgi:hypothetical protein